jgi:hypothetical protein
MLLWETRVLLLLLLLPPLPPPPPRFQWQVHLMYSTWLGAQQARACPDCEHPAAAAVVVVLSPDFVTKKYPMEELRQLLERKRAGGDQVHHSFHLALPRSTRLHCCAKSAMPIDAASMQAPAEVNRGAMQTK